MSLPRIRQRIINGYQHIACCPVVRAWVFLVIVHFIIQVTLQGLTLRDNRQAKNTTGHCLDLAHVPVGVPLLEGGNLNLCKGIPGRNNVTCILVASENNSTASSTQNDEEAEALTGFNLDAPIVITVSGADYFITGRCALSLQWIFVAFRTNIAEDVATICFQFWLLIVSLSAVLQDSIPHLAVCIASHLLDVCWAGFRIRSTIALKEDYYKLIVDDACGGEDMLGSWWDHRLAHAAPLFGTNVITLILLAALAVILFRRYTRIHVSRMGPTPSIKRLYKIALSFSAFLQLAAFFTILALGMWIDLLSSKMVTALGGNLRSEQAAYFGLVVTLAPWIISGWWAIFREVKRAFILFGVLHTFLLVLWPGMFANPIFRYTFKAWSFFACVSVTSYLFVVATAIMAVICRLHFGRGLGHFLRVESDLSSSGFPASSFTDDTASPPGGSPATFDFGLIDTEKARNGSMEKGDSPVDIRPYPLESSKYSAHTLPLETLRNASRTPLMTALPTAREASTAIIRALNRGVEKALPATKAELEFAPPSHVSPTDNDCPKYSPSTNDKEWPPIPPPPEAYLQVPYKETRVRKETPSLWTQATGVSTMSSSQAVVTLAKKDTVVSATARTVVMNTPSPTRTPSPVDRVMPHESHPSIDFGTRSGSYL